MQAKNDPTISVGGILPAIGGNIRVGGPEFFVTEACEYTNSFLSFYPTMAVILNIEEDHLDFFKDLADIRHSFKLFAERVPAQGAIVINGDIENYQEIIEAAKGKVITLVTAVATITVPVISSMTITRIRPSIFISAVRRKSA